MATYNTSEIFAKAWGKAKFAVRESKRTRTFLTGKTLRQAFSHFLKEVWKEAKKNAEPVQKFYIALSYNEVSLQRQVKSIGGKWNADSKVWVVIAKKSDLGILAERVTNNASKKSSWLVDGKVVTNNLSWNEMYNRYGMDFE